MANLQISHSDWSFITYVNLSFFTTETDHLEQTVKNIEQFCETIKMDFTLPVPSSYCDHAIPQLQHLLEQTKEFSTKWFLSQDTESSPNAAFMHSHRRKRGFFGTVSKRLFFSLSEEEAEFYRNQINLLKDENLEHLMFAKNQTTLLQETLKVLNNSMQFQLIQHSALQKQFDNLELLLNNATVSSTLTSTLTELMQYTMFGMSGLREKQQHFFEAITKKSGSFELIPPKMFFNELERVNKMIKSRGLQLPLPLLRENLAKFYQMITTEGRLIDNSLVLRFSIPLVEPRKFILYKVISAPHRNDSNESFSFIVPRNEYIGYDGLSEKFVTLTLDELRNCHRIDAKEMVCKQTFPVISVANNSGCEINLLQNTNQTTSCDFRQSNLTEELWIKLQSPNTYLFTLPMSQVAAIVCPNSRTKLYLQDTGIISLAQRCRIKSERVEIVAFQTIETKTFKNFTSPRFNVSIAAEIDKAKHIKSLQNPKLPSHISNDDIDKIKQIHDDIYSLQAHNIISKASVLNSLYSNGESEINPILLVILAAIALVLVIIIIFVCVKYCAIPGCNIILFLVLIAFIAPAVLYLL